ncbi:MAG: hypothetical protein KGZ97_02125 [Bacteroidetes bacterium]|nr:hypothetical protein [Bacteroidota bacterium]
MKYIAIIFILRFVIVLTSLSSYGSNLPYGFIHGYLINNKNDTVYGFVLNQREYHNHYQCRFKHSLEDEVLNYSPLDIKGYGFGDISYRSASVQISDVLKNSDSDINYDHNPAAIQPLFLKVLLNGKISLLSYKDNLFVHKSGHEAYLLLRNDNKIVLGDDSGNLEKAKTN